MTNINICVISWKSKELTAHLANIRRIQGLKVLKRRNKPFYDITGELATQQDYNKMIVALSNILNECGAEIEIKDNELRDKIFAVV
jgi:hypothetical protein